MDRAYCGEARWGHFRWGVYRTDWDDYMDRMKKTPAKTLGGKTPCIQGAAKQGRTRHNVKIPLFDEWAEQMKKRG